MNDKPKILLVNAPHNFGWPWGKGNVYRGFYEYLGTGYLASSLMSHGFQVEIINAPYHGWGPQKTATEIRSREFDLVGISANWQQFFPQAASLLEELTSLKQPIILGGHFSTIAHENLLRDFPFLSAIGLGECEATLVDCAKALAAGKSLSTVKGLYVVSNDSQPATRPLEEDLDSLPFPYRPEAENYRYSKNPGGAAASILASRGCNGNCSFCTVHAFQGISTGSRWRPRSPENVVDEMEMLQKDFGFINYRFVDEDFLGRSEYGRQRALDIAREILKRGLKLSFEVYCRADEVDVELLKALKKAGLQGVYLSLDAVSESDLELYNKGTTREQMINAIRAVLESQVQLAYSFIFWHPYRRLNEIHQVYTLLEEASRGNSQDYTTILKGMQTGLISDLEVLTGSPIEKQIENDGLLRGNYRQYSYDFVHPATKAAYRIMKGYQRLRRLAENTSNTLSRPTQGKS
jgi:anaerobic magnesium-protoporphyrin IX monomethyl ester cyclase